MTHEEVLDEVNVIYERISNNENNLFSDGKYTEALEVLIDYYEVGFIAELKKIMIEIGNITETKTYCGNIVFKNPQEIKNEVMEILDNHISELKGE